MTELGVEKLCMNLEKSLRPTERTNYKSLCFIPDQTHYFTKKKK